MNGTPHRHRRLVGAGAIAVLLAVLVACGDPPPPTVEAPEITTFAATPASIVAGETSTLAWTIAGTATVTLSDGTNPVAIADGATQVDVTPDATTTYTLTATNSGGTDTAQVTVTVATEAPQITTFTASPQTIGVGDNATLAWTIVGDGAVSLSDGTNPVAIAPGATSVIVSPDATTTYTLSVTNAAGSDQATVIVTVDASIDLPNIDAFSATPGTIVSGESSTLAWTVTNADSITISDGTDPVVIGGGSSVVVSPTVSTTYTLTATNADGSVDATATVTVLPPSITSFSASPDLIEVGDDSTLSWNVVGATNVTLDDGSGAVAVAPADSSTVSPATTTTYTLTATNDMGSVNATQVVTVVPVDATALAGLTATVVTGSQVQLDWSVLNATDVDVYTVANGDPNDELLVVALAGTATTSTFDIPASGRQVLRVCARATDPADDVCDDVTPTNVVVNADDYDPYDLGGFSPEAEIPGSLRSVILNAVPGTVIGFAADVTAIDLYGVALYPPGTGNVDAHLIIDKDVTISGPPSGVTLTGISGYDIGVDPDDGAGGFTYRSRMLYVIPAVDVELENLTLTGGTFIYKGGGIHNAGTLTGRNLTVTGNRAWDVGGGIWNNTGGILTLEDSLISNNRAVTEVDEVGVAFDIRGDFTICMIRSGFGGGIYNETGATVSLIDTVVSGNEAKISGGGIYNAPGGTFTVTGGSVVDNVANHFTYTDDPAYPDVPFGCEPSNTSFNPYSVGGGIYNGGTFTMSTASILTNDVHNAGGGLFIDRASDMATLTTVLIEGNVAGVDADEGFGGGIQHEFFASEGPASNYTPTDVTFGTGNDPQNVLQNSIVGPSTIGPSSLTVPLPGRYAPTPGMPSR